MSDALDPSQSPIVRIATVLETYLQLSFSVGLRVAVFTTGLFLLYVAAGIAAVLFGWLALSYPIFSLEADPFFIGGGAVVGLFVTQSSGSFVLYHILIGAEDDRSQFAILLGFISLGFGGALLRATLSPAIQLIL